MKATNEERRDVADGLRKLAQAAAAGELISVAEVMDELGVDMEDRDVYPERVEWLADLIDRPTCRYESVYASKEAQGHAPNRYACSACGNRRLLSKPNYCPICGAEVVADDDGR